MLWAAWDGVAHWWDGVELWLTQLAFALQVALLMPVLLPVCWWVAGSLDRISDLIFNRLGHRYAGDTEDARERP
ncbi:MAG: hypothetical protein JOZ09_03150 [Pseudonocardiales bacterium]|nr:hypothetical protein [Pseudonocardiales bacterium]